MVRKWMRWWLPVLIIVGGCAALPSPTDTPPPSANPTITLYPTRYQPHDDGGQFCPPPRAWYEYVIRPGDTIQSLAERTSSTVARLSAANCLQNPRLLTTGQLFYVPRRIRD